MREHTRIEEVLRLFHVELWFSAVCRCHVESLISMQLAFVLLLLLVVVAVVVFKLVAAAAAAVVVAVFPPPCVDSSLCFRVDLGKEFPEKESPESKQPPETEEKQQWPEWQSDGDHINDSPYYCQRLSVIEIWKIR